MSYATSKNAVLFNRSMAQEKIKEPNDLFLALNDFIRALKNYKFWMFMGAAEIKRRYKRTVIGPFWTTLSLAIFIACMSYMLSAMWHSKTEDFLPYFCSGYICWTLMQTCIIDGCNTFINTEVFIRQINLPYSNYAFLMLWRNFIVFAHHLAILLIVLLYSKVSININFLLVIPGLMILFFTGAWLAIFLGMICARFRDIQMVIVSLLQLAMYVTPIMWRPDQLGPKGILLAKINPLSHFISIVRLPLIGQAPSLLNWSAAIIFTVIGATLTLLFFAKKYRRLVFWL